MKFSGNRLLLVALLIVLVVLGVLALSMYRRAPSSPETNPPVAEPPRQLREVILYFGAENGEYLVPETRKIEDCPEEADCVRSTVQALANGPAGDLVPILPTRAAVRGVTVEGGTAALDFSRELITAHPGGSMSELLTVYGLADTLAENFPHIRQVRILVEGEPVDTLKGHVDLRGPVQADFSFSRQPDAAAKE